MSQSSRENIHLWLSRIQISSDITSPMTLASSSQVSTNNSGLETPLTTGSQPQSSLCLVGLLTLLVKDAVDKSIFLIKGSPPPSLKNTQGSDQSSLGLVSIYF